MSQKLETSKPVQPPINGEEISEQDWKDFERFLSLYRGEKPAGSHLDPFIIPKNLKTMTRLSPGGFNLTLFCHYFAENYPESCARLNDLARNYEELMISDEGKNRAKELIEYTAAGATKIQAGLPLTGTEEKKHWYSRKEKEKPENEAKE